MRTIALIACLAAGACGDDGGATLDAAPPDGGLDAGIDAGPAADAAPLQAYEGTWAMREVLATVAEAPIVGAVDDRAVSVNRVTATIEGEEIVLAVQTCDTQLETDSTTFTTALMPGYAQTINLTWRGQVGTGRLEATGAVALQGCNLTEPDTEPLPTEPTDPRVVDVDGDGNPGFTVIANVTGLGEVRMYMVQRTRRDLTSGRFTTPDRIHGGIAIHQFEQSVVGATNDFFATTPAVAPNEPGSSFTLVRSDLDCAAIAAQDETTLFGPRE